MNEIEDLRARVAEVRSVSQRLNRLLDDLEASFCNSEADAPETSAPGQGSAPKKKGTARKADDEPAAVKEESKARSLPEVRAILAEKCASGFGTQVKALIESYGASSLKEVPSDRYGDLLEAAAGLGMGGDAVAG